MTRYLLLSFFYCVSFLSIGQTFNPNCDGTRYFEQVFPDEPIMTTIKFGENTTIGGNFQELFMDVFEPSGDVAEKRPVLLFAFGGSFIAGDRTATHDICINYAKKGYVTAAIDYRLYDLPLPPTGPLPDSISMMKVVIKAIGDYKAAIRSLRKDADTDNQFRIDTNYIFAGGFSAGSIAALHSAYIDQGELPSYLQDIVDDNGGLEGNTDDPNNSNLGYSSEIHAVVNYFGGLNNKSWMDANDPPLVSIHGTLDTTVPYGHGSATVFFIPLVTIDGSGVLHQRANLLGLNNALITVQGGGHGNFSQAEYEEMDDLTSTFLGEIICGELSSNTALVTSNTLLLAPNPGTESIWLKFEENPGNYKVFITNQVGQVVYAKNNLVENQFELRATEIGKGLFFLNVVFENKNIRPVVRKIIFK